MTTQLSRSEQKRQSKAVEQLVQELVNLSGRDISSLPCDDFFKDEIRQANSLKGGSRKRQVKYISKGLRREPEIVDQLLDFMQERKGSQLKQDREFHEVERLRDTIINSVIALHEEARQAGHQLDIANLEGQSIPAIQEITAAIPELDKNTLLTAAWQYARSRKPTFNREIFRMIRAAREKQQFAANMKKQS